MSTWYFQVCYLAGVLSFSGFQDLSSKSENGIRCHCLSLKEATLGERLQNPNPAVECDCSTLTSHCWLNSHNSLAASCSRTRIWTSVVPAIAIFGWRIWPRK
ncbi:hypothetical protein VTK56DRAFT_2015 [Thermocarpiscus australiensis]